MLIPPEREKSTFEELHRQVVSCTRCSRLRRYCAAVAKEKKREFRSESYWGKPVLSFGDPRARIWIVGLAPAAHGANRTGRMFTGDSSGRWLYRALHHVGLANQPTSEHREDGLTLSGAYISAVAHCAPPDNKPSPKEISNCARFLDRELILLKQARIIVPLGAIAFEAVRKLFERHELPWPEPRPKFSHGLFFEAGKYHVLASYHPSRQNTQTGRLKWEMWKGIFEQARKASRA